MRRPGPGERFLMLGTSKGAFLATCVDGGRWEIAGPLLAGWDVYHVIHDPRTDALLAGASHPLHGPLVARSTDFGETWDQDTTGLEHPDGGAVTHVWNLRAAGDGEPGRIWVGVAEAGLFRSDDGARSWQPVASLRAHPSRSAWNPGGGGMCLHTILTDPRDARRMYVAISAAGVFRTDDSGRTWHPKNRGVRADFLPDPEPEVGHCVHKLVLDAENPDVLYQQNHCGVYRSDDRGDTWIDIGAGLPSRFGFPMVAHPRRSGTLFTVPLEADVHRLPPGGRFAVWRTRDGGASWQECRRGLPERNAYLVVLRHGLAADDEGGVYVATHTGHLFGSEDEADSWRLIAQYLPPIRSVEAGRR
jgi:photosystem II stability/assembly factor-like uncharacterized protein